MSIELQEQCAELTPGAPDSSSRDYLFASTSLATWTTARREQFARDFQLNDTVYRRLDPEYYAWLRARMVVAKEAAVTGHLDAAAFECLRVRFNVLHAWAIEHFGEAQLLAAVGTVRSSDYRPPRPEESDGAQTTLPTPPKLSLEADRIARAQQLIDEVCDRALALGWTMESLYFCDGYERRPFAARYGMACYIKAEHRIGEVTLQSIELIGPSPSETRSRFYNPDVEQPWIEKLHR